MKKILYSNLLIGTILLSSLHADTLQFNMQEVLVTNPIIKENLRNFRASKQDMKIAESSFYPKLDFNASADKSFSGKLNKESVNSEYDSYKLSLTLTQNLFNGFGSINKVRYQESRIQAAAYKYQEVVNDIAYKLTAAYISLLKEEALFKTSMENVNINKEMYLKVKDLYDSGFTTDSEVKKMESSLSLAKSNMTVQRNNSLDKSYALKRILGRMPNKNNMIKPILNSKIPSNLQSALLFAVSNNPSIIVSKYNLKSSKHLLRESKKNFYPKVDFMLEQNYNDISNDNPYGQIDDRFKAKILLSYSLYNGGSDKALFQKHISLVNREVDIKRDLKRQVIESLELSWNSYVMLKRQLKDLNDFNYFSQSTLELYKEEYNLGKRTLLELLTAQNDAINSKSQVIEAEFDFLLSQYRILDAMGLLVLEINNSTLKNESIYKLDADELDKELIKLDVDNDKIVDNLDLCVSSKNENNIMPYGCKKEINDNDNDGILNVNDFCPYTQTGTKVGKDGCSKDIKDNKIIINENTDSSIEKVFLYDEPKGKK